MFIWNKWSKVVIYIFVYLKQIQVFRKFLPKFIIVNDIYAQKVKCIVIIKQNIQVVKLEQF